MVISRCPVCPPMLFSFAIGAVEEEAHRVLLLSVRSRAQRCDGFREEGFLLEVHRCRESFLSTDGEWPRAQPVPKLTTERRSIGSFEGSRNAALDNTFFDIAEALKCPLAAATLVLRGCNITRAYWTIGLGGVGQSMNSVPIENLFGKLHAHVDMNMF